MTIVDRVARIEERHGKASDLAEKAEKTNEQRNKAERKNSAFQSLQSKLEDVQSEYKTLGMWRSLADAMGVTYNTDAVERLKNKMENDLRAVTGTDFAGFEDDQEVRDLEDNFSDYSTELSNQQSEIRNQIQTRCDELLDELATKRTVLRIPDVGSTDDEQVIEEFRQFLQNHKGGTLQQNPAVRYNELAGQYDDIDISFDAVQEEYDIGDDAMAELKKLLNNKQVTLAKIDEDVLNDLKNLPQFSRLLTIQFKEDE
jgi:DNA repair exonuclease SbcCD ATPase subunit